MSATAIDIPLIRYAAAVYDPSDVVEARLVCRRKGKDRRQSFSVWCFAWELSELGDTLTKYNRDDWEIYIGANPRRAHGLRGDANVAIARTLFVDFDETVLDAALKRIADAGLPMPTLVIRSGHGIHCYWRLAVPMEDLALWSRIMRRLIALLDSDPCMHNPERIMRPPGFLNIKRAPHVPCEIVTVDATRRTDLDAIVGILDVKGIPANPKPKKEAGSGKSAALPKITKSSSPHEGASVIDAFNEAHDVAEILKQFGYTEAGSHRLNRPGGETAGVHLRGGLAFHFSSNDGLNDQHFGYFAYSTPFSAWCRLKHGGDVKKAVREAALMLGMERDTSITMDAKDGEYFITTSGFNRGVSR